MLLRALPFVVIIAVAAGPARGDALGELDAGIAAYDAGDLHRAAPLLRAATKAALAPRERARAWLFLGLTLASLEGLPSARNAFRAAVAEDPEISVDGDRVPRTVVAELERVRRTVTGELGVDAEEPAARVFVGGTERGKTPSVLRLPVGRHTVRVVSADAYRAYEAKGVLVSARSPVRVRARLTPLVGRLRVALKPRGAQLMEGNRVVATAADSAVAVPAGPHRFVARAPGRVEEVREVVVEASADAELRVALRPLPVPWYRKRRAWGWVSLGLAAGSAAAGVVAGLLARSSADALATGEREQTLSARRYAELSSSADARARAANVLFGVGAAATVTGVVLLLLGDKRTEETPRAGAWRIVPAPGGAGVAVRF